MPIVLWNALVESDDDRIANVESGFDGPEDINTPEDYRSLIRTNRG